jgi:predicted phage tail protein
MAVLGIPLIAVGSLCIADHPLTLPRDLRPNIYDGAVAAGSVLAVHGVGLTLGGIIAMATTKGNRAEVRAYRPAARSNW